MGRDEKGRFPIKLKHCPRCNRDLAIRKFGKNAQTKDRKNCYCKDCVNRETRARQLRLKAQDPIAYRENQNKIRRQFNKGARGRYWVAKYNARKKLVSFEINIEDFVKWYESQPKTCYYCGLNFSGVYHQDPLAETFDRKDNIEGYTLANIVLACRRCNTVKGNWFTCDEMLEIAQKYLSNRYGGVSSAST